MTKDLQEIGYWLYDKSKEYGYSINSKKTFDKGCIYYTKGSKEFILAGEKDGRAIVKTIFRDVFKSHPEKISVLAKIFSDTLGGSGTLCSTNCKPGKPCSMRIC